MKFKDLINYLDEQFPKSLSVSWDNDGVEVCVDYNLEIGRTLIALDVTFEAIDYAITHGYNCILSHHPMIYDPIKKLDLSNSTSKKAVMLARHNICAASFHTRLDAVSGGVNECFINALGIAGSVELLYEDNIPIGRLVTLGEEVSLPDFAGGIKNNRAYGNKKVKKIGVVAGSGMDFAETAAKMGADTFLTGEGKYHSILDAYESYNINIITAGHFETEVVVLPFIKEKILEQFPDAKVDCFTGENWQA